VRTVSQAVRSQATVSIAHVERDVDRYREVFDAFLALGGGVRRRARWQLQSRSALRR
jgi:hypothetical protein